MISFLFVFVFGVVVGGLAEHYLHPVESKVRAELTALSVDLSRVVTSVSGLYGHVSDAIKKAEPSTPVPPRQVPNR